MTNSYVILVRGVAPHVLAVNTIPKIGLGNFDKRKLTFFKLAVRGCSVAESGLVEIFIAVGGGENRGEMEGYIGEFWVNFR